MATAKAAGQRPKPVAVQANFSGEGAAEPEVGPVDEGQPPIEIPDDRDTVKRQPTQRFSGKVVKATPTHGGTTIEMRPEDWANVGIAGHPLVRWDFLINKFMVPAESLTPEALDYLLEHDPSRFEVVEVKNATE